MEQKVNGTDISHSNKVMTSRIKYAHNKYLDILNNSESEKILKTYL